MLLPSKRRVLSTPRPLPLSRHLRCSDHSAVLIHPPRTNAPWGLGRISSQTKLANQDATTLTFSYDYDSTAGSGATVFIIGGWGEFDRGSSTNSHDLLDTGIFTSHVSRH